MTAIPNTHVANVGGQCLSRCHVCSPLLFGVLVWFGRQSQHPSLACSSTERTIFLTGLSAVLLRDVV